jgi:SAM-dependent methyltransferase
MNSATSAPVGLASRLINGALAIAPVANLLKQQARSMMIKRAESIGVAWTQEAAFLRARGEETWSAALAQVQTPGLTYPDYYLQPFHAYNTGNLSWEAATEVEVAAYAAHARIWSDAGSKEGDARLRHSFHTLLKQHYPDAAITGLDLSPYFLAIAQYRTQQTLRNLEWIHSAAENTPFPDQSFDLVSICLMCHELPQNATKAIFQEAKRLLKPGGHFAIMDMNPKSEVFAKLPPYVFTLLKTTEPHLDEYFTLDFEAALMEAGFNRPFTAKNSPRHRTFIADLK